MELVNCTDLRPSTYNPRRADPARLNLVALSLSRLGFVLPIYADRGGEILSGHQRLRVASEMLGATKVPVEWVDCPDVKQRMSLNLLFNRATNDFARGQTSTSITRDAFSKDPIKLAEHLPERRVDSPEFWPVMHARQVPTGSIVAVNSGWRQYARSVAGAMLNTGVPPMPIVATPDLHVVNGIGRLHAAAERNEPHVVVVEVSPEQAAFADICLNLLSMDFDMDGDYADLLRYNSFRRTRHARYNLGIGFLAAMDTRLRSKDFDVVGNPAHRKRWMQFYGTRVVDFGAGLGQETAMLRKAGIDVASFEPFVQADMLTDVLDPERSRAGVRVFLQDIAQGRSFDSLFCSTVLNSIPFHKDREHVATLLAALAGKGRVYALTKSQAHPIWTLAQGVQACNEQDAKGLRFPLEYEHGTLLADVKSLPKVQRYFTAKEIWELFKQSFKTVQVTAPGHNILAICQGPAVTWERVREAIAFEFDLPYPDGGRMGLVREAETAFAARWQLDRA